MTQEIEIEYKNLLTKQEFDHLLHSLSFPQTGQKQTNYYFETNNFALKARGSALRIREKNGNYQLTLKEPHTSGLLETHDVLTASEAKDWLQGEVTEKEHTAEQLNKMDISPEELIYCGSLTTERREVQYGQVLLVLDYSFYNGQTDYEFELEAPDETVGLETFHTLLTEHHIPERETPNKIQRFFSSLTPRDETV